MKKPILVIMAAGRGSRYGGLKQIDALGPSGECLLDYSIYDAIQAGFERVVFIINHKIKDEFIATVGQPLEKYVKVAYAYQELEDIPAGITIPEGREKPWGTSHAIYAARDVIDAPFAVINADDYYGREAFEKMYTFLTDETKKETELCMIGYLLKNTITDKGDVSRGVCQVNSQNQLEEIVERLKIEMHGDGIEYLDERDVWQPISGDSVVSMNMWGFRPFILKEIEQGLPAYLNEKMLTNPLKGEYYIPAAVDQLIKSNKISVDVLSTDEKWYGVTYKEDKDEVVAALKAMADQGKYPEKLWN